MYVFRHVDSFECVIWMRHTISSCYAGTSFHWISWCNHLVYKNAQNLKIHSFETYHSSWKLCLKWVQLFHNKDPGSHPRINYIETITCTSIYIGIALFKKVWNENVGCVSVSIFHRKWSANKWASGRVTRRVCEKIAQNVAKHTFCQN
jgi:hypothetical protein